MPASSRNFGKIVTSSGQPKTQHLQTCTVAEPEHIRRFSDGSLGTHGFPVIREDSTRDMF